MNIVFDSLISVEPGGSLLRFALVVSKKWRERMNWDRIQGNWKQFQGKVQQQWGKLTEDDLDVVEGNRKELVGRIQERYGIAKDEAERQVREWESRQ
jgi:uncharacterized protein YjbJ (UPF0337 family)